MPEGALRRPFGLFPSRNPIEGHRPGHALETEWAEVNESETGIVGELDQAGQTSSHLGRDLFVR